MFLCVPVFVLDGTLRNIFGSLRNVFGHLQILSDPTKNLIYLFIYLLFSHNKDYTSITLYKDVARGPQKTTRLVRGGPLLGTPWPPPWHS